MTYVPPDVELYDSSWTSLKDDQVGSLTLDKGLPGTRPSDRVAGTGILTFNLNNSAVNSQSLLGYYSPDHSNAWSAFEVGALVRCSWGNIYKFYGRILSIVPISGQYGKRTVEVTAVDFMDRAATEKIQLVAAQLDKTAGELMATVVAEMDTAPLIEDFDSGISTFAYALDSERDEKNSILSVFQKIALSERGYIYPTGDSSSGETLVFEDRHRRDLDMNPRYSFSDSMTGIEVVYSKDSVINRVIGPATPREVDAAATTSLATLQSSLLIAWEKTETVKLSYRDPGGGSRISGIGSSITYAANSQSDGSGVDLSDDLTITPTYGGNQTKCVIENTGTGSVWLTELEVVGKAIYLFDPISIEKSDATSVAKYDDQPYTLRLPYVDDVLEAADFASNEVYRRKDGVRDVRSMTLIAEALDTSFTRVTEDANIRVTEDANIRVTETENPVFSHDIGWRITVAETVTGISQDFYIHHINISVNDRATTCQWMLAEADTRDFWEIGVDLIGVAADEALIGV